MKGIIVVDMPECCKDCDFCRMLMTDNEACCEMTEDENDCECYKMIDCDDFQGKPSWCPIRPMPERKSGSSLTLSPPLRGRLTGYEIGWNDCIDSIMGGGECQQEKN